MPSISALWHINQIEGRSLGSLTGFWFSNNFVHFLLEDAHVSLYQSPPLRRFQLIGQLTSQHGQRFTGSLVKMDHTRRRPPHLIVRLEATISEGPSGS